jgi:aerobic carbon-monoxide dehydrogenase medium subunit
MKPPPFTYHAPTTVSEALDALAAVGDDGKVLAGGQSLIPLLNMRLAAPPHLIDINGVDELEVVTVDGSGVTVGARVRHAALEHHEAALAACPLLGDALPLVAHPVIRNRGTVCGSIAHADPAGELTAVLALVGGTVHVASRVGGAPSRRDVAAADFFLGPLTSALRPAELVESVTFPAVRGGTAFAELARRHGDYALCGAGAVVDLDDDDRVRSARLGFISVGPVPVVVDVTDTLGGETLDDAALEAASRRARDAVDPDEDIHASADYRRHLAGVLAARALGRAARAAAARRTAA